MDQTRKMWLEAMLRIVNPVLENLAERRLGERIPVQFHPERQMYQCLEAFGRTACGIAPWLELEGVTGEEGEQQANCRLLMRKAMDAATDPDSPDYMNFSQGYGQALVDAAFLAQGILRAPKQLYGALEDRVKQNVAAALKQTRKFVPFETNWVLFSGIIEAALLVMGEPDYDLVRAEYARASMERWYLGDGTYGDGAYFHWDYYNSFVIHPMYFDLLDTFRGVRPEYEAFLEKARQRSSRYAAVLEQLIGPEGIYPVIGRSVTYRFGAFHLLAQAAWKDFLPEQLAPGQVRSALTAVIGRTMACPGMFDGEGWLTPGVCGEQPDLAEDYISVGSLYLCTAVFLPLGLSPEDRFWTAPEADWTGKKIWSGQNVRRDHAVDE